MSPESAEAFLPTLYVTPASDLRPWETALLQIIAQRLGLRVVQTRWGDLHLIGTSSSASNGVTGKYPDLKK